MCKGAGGERGHGGLAGSPLPGVGVPRHGWRGRVGSREDMPGQFPGCDEEGVWAPAVSSVRGTEL